MHERLLEYGSLYDDEEEERLKPNPTTPGNADEEETAGQQPPTFDGNQLKQDTDFTESQNDNLPNGLITEKKYTQRLGNEAKAKRLQSTAQMNNSGMIDQSMLGESVNHKLSEIFSNSGD